MASEITILRCDKMHVLLLFMYDAKECLLYVLYVMPA